MPPLMQEQVAGCTSMSNRGPMFDVAFTSEGGVDCAISTVAEKLMHKSKIFKISCILLLIIKFFVRHNLQNKILSAEL